MSTTPAMPACALALALALSASPLAAQAPAKNAELALRLENHVRKLCAIDPPRSHLHPESLDRIAAYIAEHFLRAGCLVRYQSFEIDGKSYRNVCALLGPAEGERVVVGAHYDVCGDGPGADDNASGVAGLIELAYLLAGTKLDRCVELVAYTLEEPPHFGTANMGSAHHARELLRRGVKLRAMLALEMIGCFSDEEGSQTYPVELLKERYGTAGDFILLVARGSEKKLVEQVSTAMTEAAKLRVETFLGTTLIKGLGIDLSDHRNYWEAGYPALMVTDTAFLRNPNYHEDTDTPDTLDYARMAMVVRGVCAAVRKL